MATSPGPNIDPGCATIGHSAEHCAHSHALANMTLVASGLERAMLQSLVHHREVADSVQAPALQVLTMGVHKATIVRGSELATGEDAEACGVRLLHAMNMYDVRFDVKEAATDSRFTNNTDWQWVLSEAR